LRVVVQLKLDEVAAEGGRLFRAAVVRFLCECAGIGWRRIRDDVFRRELQAEEGGVDILTLASAVVVETTGPQAECHRPLVDARSFGHPPLAGTADELLHAQRLAVPARQRRVFALAVVIEAAASGRTLREHAVLMRSAGKALIRRRGVDDDEVAGG